jgi:hypothetical protein
MLEKFTTLAIWTLSAVFILGEDSELVEAECSNSNWNLVEL